MDYDVKDYKNVKPIPMGTGAWPLARKMRNTIICFFVSLPVLKLPRLENILVTLYNDGPASAVLVAVRTTFQSRYVLCQMDSICLALLINEMK